MAHDTSESNRITTRNNSIVEQESSMTTLFGHIAALLKNDLPDDTHARNVVRSIQCINKGIDQLEALDLGCVNQEKLQQWTHVLCTYIKTLSKCNYSVNEDFMSNFNLSQFIRLVKVYMKICNALSQQYDQAACTDTVVKSCDFYDAQFKGWQQKYAVWIDKLTQLLGPLADFTHSLQKIKHSVVGKIEGDEQNFSVLLRDVTAKYTSIITGVCPCLEAFNHKLAVLSAWKDLLNIDSVRWDTICNGDAKDEDENDCFAGVSEVYLKCDLLDSGDRHGFFYKPSTGR